MAPEDTFTALAGSYNYTAFTYSYSSQTWPMHVTAVFLSLTTLPNACTDDLSLPSF